MNGYDKNKLRKSTFFFFFFLMLVVFSFSSCKRLVTIPNPETQIAAKAVFDNSASATAALTDIYFRLFSSNLSFGLASTTGVYGDELTSYSAGADYRSLYQNALTSGSMDFGNWSLFYQVIYEANAVIEGLGKSSISPAVKKQLDSEARFCRAFCHFYLASLYSDVPLILSTNYFTNSRLARTAVAAVLNQVVDDLKIASSNLNDFYVNSTDTAISLNRIRPNKATALALLARTYLFQGDWGNAKDAATAVISQTGLYRLCNNLDSVFLYNSPEAIWQLFPSFTGFNTTDAVNFILTTPPAGNDLGKSSTISDDLLSSFDSADKRRNSWMNKLVAGPQVYYFPYKYKINSTSNTSISECSTVFRLAELYLIRSESMLHLNDVLGAVDDLNMIRRRAGLPIFQSVNSDSIMNEIVRQRRLELFTEWGHRWLDLRRLNLYNNIMPLVASKKGGIWSPYKVNFPIPQSDITKNANLTQNQGY